MNIKILIPFFSLILPLAFSSLLSMNDNKNLPAAGRPVTGDSVTAKEYVQVRKKDVGSRTTSYRPLFDLGLRVAVNVKAILKPLIGSPYCWRIPICIFFKICYPDE